MTNPEATSAPVPPPTEPPKPDNPEPTSAPATPETSPRVSRHPNPDKSEHP